MFDFQSEDDDESECKHLEIIKAKENETHDTCADCYAILEQSEVSNRQFNSLEINRKKCKSIVKELKRMERIPDEIIEITNKIFIERVGERIYKKAKRKTVIFLCIIEAYNEKNIVLSKELKNEFLELCEIDEKTSNKWKFIISPANTGDVYYEFHFPKIKEKIDCNLDELSKDLSVKTINKIVDEIDKNYDCIMKIKDLHKSSPKNISYGIVYWCLKHRIKVNELNEKKISKVIRKLSQLFSVSEMTLGKIANLIKKEIPKISP